MRFYSKKAEAEVLEVPFYLKAGALFHYNLVSFASFLLSSAFLLPEKEALNKDSWKLEYPTYLNQTFIGTNSALALRF